MSNGAYHVVKPDVSYKMYWPECLLLLLSVLTPVVAWLIRQNGEMLQNSGILVVFFAAVAEFISIHRMNKKHILNACRVRNNEAPWDFSPASKLIGWLAFFCALAGIILSGFGNLIVGT